MGFLKKFTGILGLGKEGHHHGGRADENGHDLVANHGIHNVHGYRAGVDPIPGAPRMGFGVPVQVAVERPNLGPLIVPCDGDGGVQGLKWYAKRFRVDEDGDVGDEFVDQVSDDEPNPQPKFQVKYSARPAKVMDQVMSFDGKLQQCVDYRGRLLWV